ncbi:uncharacterized protein METZ01_LOCUS339760 [marine metagenome]|uniref:Uncharacterized protein n=1 Tax=marine metagenome TaxID=408172 RepID=A0A382QN72_9ZZZZ
MAINIIIRTVIAIFSIGLGFMIGMPIMYELAYNASWWDNANSQSLVLRDNLYSIFMLMPLILISVVVLWAYMAATRKTVYDEYA